MPKPTRPESRPPIKEIKHKSFDLDKNACSELAASLGVDQLPKDCKQCVEHVLSSHLTSACVLKKQTKTRKTTPANVKVLLTDLRHALLPFLHESSGLDADTYRLLHTLAKEMRSKVERRMAELDAHQKLQGYKPELLRMSAPLLRKIFYVYAADKHKTKIMLRRFVAAAFAAAELEHPNPADNPARLDEFIESDSVV